jgi:hypothetical protein
MKFEKLFDYLYFIKSVEKNIKDGGMVKKLNDNKSLELEDKDYFMLTDSVESYMGEIAMYSKEKSFYKKLQDETLSVDNMPNLFAFQTHLSIGLSERLKTRSVVDYTHFIGLKNIIDNMVTTILKEGSCVNTLKPLMK